MIEKRYPQFEEEESIECMNAAEPALACTAKSPASSSGVVYMEAEAEKIDRIPLGGLGFYTDNPKELEQRVAEIEADMDEVEAGIESPEKWISSEQMWANLYHKYPWLR